MRYFKDFIVSSFIVLLSLSLAVMGCGKQAENKPVAQNKPVAPAAPVGTGREITLYSFEKDMEYWAIPDWSLEKPDYVTKSAEVSKDYVKIGSSSLKLTTDFPGKTWKAALIELEEYLDWTPYNKISCDIYLPKGAPEGLKAKIILTVGDDWKFTEMSRAVFLIPGRWNTLSASLIPGTDDWKMTVVDDNLRKDIRKMAIRIESNKGPIYSGPIYIDNIRVTE